MHIEGIDIPFFSPFLATKYATNIKNISRVYHDRVIPHKSKTCNKREEILRLTRQMIMPPHAGKFPTYPLGFQIV